MSSQVGMNLQTEPVGSILVNFSEFRRRGATQITFLFPGPTHPDQLSQTDGSNDP